jgi:hypothetical protein
MTRTDLGGASAVPRCTPCKCRSNTADVSHVVPCQCVVQPVRSLIATLPALRLLEVEGLRSPLRSSQLAPLANLSKVRSGPSGTSQ